MKQLITLVALIVLLPVSVLHARGLGDYARDYSWRAEKSRVSRESIAATRAAREARIAERSLRRQSRSRTTPRAINAQSRLEVRQRARSERLSVAKLRGDARRTSRTSAQRSANIQTKADWRMDARRRADLRSIMSVLVKFKINPDLEHAELIPSSQKYICKTGYEICNDGVNLDLLIYGSELKAFPVDVAEPRASAVTGYTAQNTSSGTLLLTAPRGNAGKGIELEWEPVEE